MTINERAAYLKGLMEGMKLDTETNEGKLLSAVIEAIGEICEAVTDLEDCCDAVCEELDDVVDSIDDIEELLDTLYDDDDYDLDDDDEFDFEDDEDVYYSVKCPTCNEEITIDPEILEAGGIKCPACGEELEFDLGDDCDCEDCK